MQFKEFPVELVHGETLKYSSNPKKSHWNLTKARVQWSVQENN